MGKWNGQLIGVAVVALAVCSSCGGADPSADVNLGAYQFTGTMDMAIDNCTSHSPIADWTTVLSAEASDEPLHIWVTETAYGCTLLIPLAGAVANGGGLSCPVSTLGFFREDFVFFRWDFSKKTLEYSSVLYGQDIEKNVIKYCATVRGSIVRR